MKGVGPLGSLLLWCLAVLTAGGQDFAVIRDEATSALIPELESIADWCRVHKLYGDSVRVYVMILKVDPEHAHARRVLRYRRSLDGSWVQSPDFREPKNLSDAKAGEFQSKLAAILAPYCARILDAIAHHRETISDASKRQILRDLLELSPEDSAVRSAYLESGDSMGVDAVGARLRRDELARAARAALASVAEPKIAEPSSLEKDLGIRWSVVAASAHVRVLASGERDEGIETSRACEAAGILFKRAFMTEPRYRDGFTIYLLGHAADKANMLNRHPGVTPELRKFVEPLEGAWIGPSRVVEWHSEQSRRVDGAVRQTLATMLRDIFGVTMKQAWASEGFGIYLTWHLIGTRRTWHVDRSHYGGGPSKLRQRLMVGTTDWLLEARTMLAGNDKPDLRSVLATSVNDMTDAELLYAYALAAHLLETSPQKVPEMLRFAGAGALPDDLVRQALDLSLGELETRVRDWLEATAR